nr:MAG TPA: hypothetical protein [Bacteriophage sp.]
MKYVLDESCFSEAERIIKEHHEKFKKRKKRDIRDTEQLSVPKTTKIT